MSSSTNAQNFTQGGDIPGQSSSGKVHLLLVDHDATFRKVMQLCLESLGYDVSAANGGEEALARSALNHGIQLLLTDVVMPGMSGVELARRLRETHPRLEVLFMSGRPRAAIPELATEVETSHFLQKPFGSAQLDERIKAILAPGIQQAPNPITFGSKPPPEA